MFWSVAIERITIKLPDGFDPGRHAVALAQLIEKQHGDGFEIDHIDPEAGTATASRQAAITEVTERKTDKPVGGNRTSRSMEVRLPRGTKPTDGDKVAAKMADQYGGFYLTTFDPFLGKAVLTELDDETARCRGAVAVALGVKEWDVQVSKRRGGGFHLVLPKSYTPSKHNDKLHEVAVEVVGREGWYVDANPAKLTADIVPGEPPTFAAVMPYPMQKLAEANRTEGASSKLLIGRALSERADQDGYDAYIDFEAAAHTQVSGTSGSGKSVTLHAMISFALASGHELAIVDLPHKAVDFIDFKKFVRPGGWGCATATMTTAEWLPQALTTLGLIYDEGMRRAGLLAQYNVTKVGDLPKSARVKPIFVVCDEVTGILQLDDVPKGVPKDHPMVVEANQSNLMRQMILGYMKKIAAELRFAGIRMVLSSQVSSVNTGVPTSLRMNLAQKLLMGPNPTEGNRKLSLADPTSVPTVPENVKADGRASKGVGVAELEGQPNIVFKPFYASPAQFVAVLDKLGLPTTDRPQPSRPEIDKYTPSLDDDDEPPARAGNASNDYGFAQQSDGEFIRDFDRKAEGGFAHANDARRQLDQTAGTARKKKADPFDMPAASEVTVRRVEPRTPDQNNPFARSPD